MTVMSVDDTCQPFEEIGHSGSEEPSGSLPVQDGLERDSGIVNLFISIRVMVPTQFPEEPEAFWTVF